MSISSNLVNHIIDKLTNRLVSISTAGSETTLNGIVKDVSSDFLLLEENSGHPLLTVPLAGITSIRELRR